MHYRSLKINVRLFLWHSFNAHRPTLVLFLFALHVQRKELIWTVNQSDEETQDLFWRPTGRQGTGSPTFDFWGNERKRAPDEVIPFLKDGSSTRMAPLGSNMFQRNCWTMSITTLIGRLLIQLIGHTQNPLVVGQRGETAESLGWLKLPWPCFWERLWWPNLGWSAGGYATYQATVPW